MIEEEGEAWAARAARRRTVVVESIVGFCFDGSGRVCLVVVLGWSRGVEVGVDDGEQIDELSVQQLATVEDKGQVEGGQSGLPMGQDSVVGGFWIGSGEAAAQA